MSATPKVVHSPQRRTYEIEAIPAIATANVEEASSAPSAGTCLV